MVTDTKFVKLCHSVDDREEWLQVRNLGVGASETPCLFGEYPNRMSPISLAAQKSGTIPPFEGNEYTRAGLRLEPFIAEWALEEMGKRGQPYGWLIRSVEHSWMQCTPDWMVEERELDGPDGIRRMVPFQIKNTMLASDWDDGVPTAVMIQCQHELIVTGAPWGYVAALLTGNRIRWAKIEPDHELQKKIVEETAKFWDDFSHGREMEVDGSAATTMALKAMHPADNGETIALDGKLMEMSREVTELKDERKITEKEIVTRENKLRAAIGDATYGTFPDGSGYSLKTTVRKGFTTKDSTFRTLRAQKATS